MKAHEIAIGGFLSGVAACCGAIAFVQTFGWGLSLWLAAWGFIAVSCLATFVGAAVAYSFAPSLVRNSLPLALVMVFTLSLLVTWTARGREDSRRLQCTQRLMAIGREMGNQQQLFADGKPSEAQFDARWRQYYAAEFVAGSPDANVAAP